MTQEPCQRRRHGLPPCPITAELERLRGIVEQQERTLKAMAERILAAHDVIAACAERRNDDAMREVLRRIVAANDTTPERVAKTQEETQKGTA